MLAAKPRIEGRHALHLTPQATMVIRPAAPDDAPVLSDLFAEAYSTGPGDNARDHYPFPQFLDADWVAHAVTRDDICWLVADCGDGDDGVIGTIGALRNIGSEEDRVAEGFGLVVGRRAQRRGVGSALLGALAQAVADESHFLLAETRTASPGGFKSVRRTGFTPIGFEPFAHSTPAGMEAMLMAARISDAALAGRNGAAVTAEVAPLASLVLSAFDQAAVAQRQGAAYRTEPGAWGEVAPRLTPLYPGDDQIAIDAAPNAAIELSRDDRLGPAIMHAWATRNPHESGVIGLRRLEGNDRRGRRYERRHYIARINGHALACARVVWDRNDHRARILELHTRSHGLQGMVIGHIIEDLKRGGAGRSLTIVLDVLASNADLQATLRRLGFFPSIYYPGLVMHDAARDDAVQFTRLLGHDASRGRAVAPALDWPEARALMMTVVNAQ